MIGIVVVCHSRPLADAAVDFAARAVDGAGPPIVVAAGTSDGALGTDAVAIGRAVAEADSGDGVLVLLDLGSALLSAELAVEFLPDELAARTLITAAPLLEGLVAAVASAAAGTDLTEADAAARQAYTLKRDQVDEGLPARPLFTASAHRPAGHPHPIVWRTTVRNPHGLHIRPAAALVTALASVDADVQLTNATTGAGPVPAHSLSRVAALEIGRGQVLQARISGAAAEEAHQILADLATNDFNEDLTPRPARVPLLARPAIPTPTDAAGPSDTLPVIGSVTLRASGPSTRGYHPGTPKEELDRFTTAAADVGDFLASLAEMGDPTGIVGAQATLLADREINHDIVTRITEGYSCVDAVKSELSRAARAFEALSDPYLRERAQDVRGIRRLLLLALMGRPLFDEGPDRPHIWVVDELDPPTALRLDPRTCLGVITINGGDVGHGVLTARARGIPVLAGRRDAAALAEGAQVAFDPLEGELWVEPDAARRAALAELRVERRRTAQEAMASAHLPAVTLDGRTIPVQVNVATIADARSAHRLGADGAGLVRTEILFATRAAAPDAEEQAAAYVALARELGEGAPITLRTWDVGADKPLPFAAMDRAENPALSVRGLRAMHLHEDLFRTQLTACLLAAREVPVRVLFPMVGTVTELTWAKDVLTRVRRRLRAAPIPVGIMIEIPAAAIRAADFAGKVDFVSIGTNDLAQYTRAADRADPDVGHLARQDDPAVFDLIAMTCRGLPDVPVSVCGDLAGDPRATARLLALGVAELSVPPPRVPAVKQAVRAVQSTRDLAWTADGRPFVPAVAGHPTTHADVRQLGETLQR